MKKYLALAILTLCTVTIKSEQYEEYVKQEVENYKNNDPRRHRLYNTTYVQEYRTEHWMEFKQRIIELIKDNGLDAIDKPLHGLELTPLCYAIEGNDFNFVTFLLENGANPNKEIKNTQASEPIQFANTVEMVKFLQENGADIYKKNQGNGITGGMDFLHAAFSCYTADDRLILHALAHEFDEQSLNNDGGNLWHSFIRSNSFPDSSSIWCCTEDDLITRARLLKRLGINPDHKNNRGKSAIDIIEDEIASENKYLSHRDATDSYIQERIVNQNKRKKLLNIMQETVSQQQDQQSEEIVSQQDQQSKEKILQ